MSAPPLLRTLIVALSLIPLLAGCKKGEAESSSAAAKTIPAVDVSVVTVTPEALPIINELPGRIAPTRIAEVRPRVSGIIVERVFEQGAVVQQGDVLYRIDPAPFRVQVESARATLQRAEAVQLQARQEADRQKELRERNVVSAQRYEDAVAALAQANAEVAIAQAGLAAAELNLDYAEVKAPISGRIGRALITEGALVSPAGPVLATIQQLDPVYADFTQSATDLLRLRRAAQAGALTGADAEAVPVQLLMDDGSAYPHPGRLLFSEATVDPTTGQVTLRGEFPNPDGDLLPGMYVRVLVQQGVQQNAIAVPQQATQRDTSGRAQVYVVDGNGAAELRIVTTGRAIGNRWAIEDGLSAGDRVIVEGFQKIRPGMPVTAQPWTPGPDAESPRGVVSETAANDKAG